MASKRNSSTPRDADVYTETVEGYVHLLSGVKTAANSKKTNYFDCKLQTSEDDSLRLVCYSPKKRENLQQAYTSHSPVKIVGTKKNNKKRFNTDTEEHCISKNAKITPAEDLTFPFNPSLSNRFHTVKEALQANLYEIVDLKVKIITKSENKKAIVKNEVSMYKIDTIVAYDTDTIKLVLWQELIDKVHTGLSYHFQNLTIRIFDDVKYVNSNEMTIVTPIDDIPIYMESPEIKDNLLIGQCIGIDLKKTTSCIVCNKTQEVDNDEEFLTCINCKMTTLTSVLKTKLVCQLLIKTSENKLQNFTCFTDGIQSFLKLKNCNTATSELAPDEIKKMLLTAGELHMIASNSTKVISQFLEYEKETEI